MLHNTVFIVGVIAVACSVLLCNLQKFADVFLCNCSDMVQVGIDKASVFVEAQVKISGGIGRLLVKRGFLNIPLLDWGYICAIRIFFALSTEIIAYRNCSLIFT